LYNSLLPGITKPIEFRGNALAELSRFPAKARREAGFQLFQVQQGEDPNDWKPMEAIGSGVREIRIRDENGAFRVIYVAKFAGAIYVLHCFQKKTQRTSPKDIAVARQRYKELAQEVSK
jgi:phage-related protein